MGWIYEHVFVWEKVSRRGHTITNVGKLASNSRCNSNKLDDFQKHTHVHPNISGPMTPFCRVPLNALFTAESWNVSWLVSTHSSTINLDLQLRSNWMCAFLLWSHSEPLFTLNVSIQLSWFTFLIARVNKMTKIKQQKRPVIKSWFQL